MNVELWASSGTTTPTTKTVKLWIMTLTIATALGMFRSKTDAPTEETWLGHDPESHFQDGCHCCYVGPMPQQLTIHYVFMFLKPDIKFD